MSIQRKIILSNLVMILVPLLLLFFMGVFMAEYGGKAVLETH